MSSPSQSATNLDGVVHVVDCFEVYRCAPEGTYRIPAPCDGDPVMEIRIAAIGGGTVGAAYADNGWIYGVWLDGVLACSGADLRSGGIAHTHRHMAAILAECLAGNAPAPLRPHGERLGQWASDEQHPDGEADRDV
jgi:hypothetical protein